MTGVKIIFPISVAGLDSDYHRETLAEVVKLVNQVGKVVDHPYPIEEDEEFVDYMDPCEVIFFTYITLADEIFKKMTAAYKGMVDDAPADKLVDLLFKIEALTKRMNYVVELLWGSIDGRITIDQGFDGPDIRQGYIIVQTNNQMSIWGDSEEEDFVDEDAPENILRRIIIKSKPLTEEELSGLDIKKPEITKGYLDS